MTDTTTPASGFAPLGLVEPILRALHAEGYQVPTPIQAQAIPPLLAGRDLLGIAQTGTGKTAAFALPLLQKLAQANLRPQPRGARALILAPTRELAIQIDASLAAYGRHLRLRHAVILGGVSQNNQVKALAAGVDILVATPGRLLDLVNQRWLNLGAVSHFVLDEADRMLDIGFIQPIRKIVAMLPRERQSVMFSATMPADIGRLAREILRDPVNVAVTPPAATVDLVQQRVLHVDGPQKRTVLTQMFADKALSRVIVFTRTKRGANRVAEQLERAGIPAEAIHGNKSQGARQRALENFRVGRARALVATDIAARGIDIDDISHVINFELPNEPETYVHRIGRTARAGASGIALSLCDAGERSYLRDIEKLIGRRLEVVGAQPQPSANPGRDRPNFHSAPAERGEPRRDYGPRHGNGPRHKGRNRFPQRPHTAPSAI